MIGPRMRPADWMWVGIGVGVLAYESVAVWRGWELLSSACDRYRERHPWATRGIIGYLFVHLMRLIPRHIDPLHVVARRME